VALTYGELRKTLADTQATWSLHPGPADDEEIPQPPLGVPETIPRIETVTPIDLVRVLSETVTPPHLAATRLALGVPADTVSLLGGRGVPAAAIAPTPPGGAPGTRPAVVDWRSAYGMNWVTAVRDQDPCESCWAFASTGVVETMTHILYHVWSPRSEGDVRDGYPHTCGDGEWPQNAINWMHSHDGSCDPACYPYYNSTHAWSPTPDRGGRTVIPVAPTELTAIEDQKNWLWSVGPITCVFQVYTDFGGSFTGVYRKTATATYRGLHAVMLIGYDDNLGCWIGKNSWGTSFGDGGFFKIAYGECMIDSYSKFGVNAVDPDPWTRRRLHNGNLLESSYGAQHRNFEVVASTAGNEVRHFWRNDDVGSMPWNAGPTFGNDAAACPTMTQTTFSRNMEIVYLTTGNRLHHWWRDQSFNWHDGGVFGPADAAGIPAFIQGNYGAPGNFEVVVRTADGRLNHWWRDGSFAWHDGGRFASGVALSGASLVQSNYGTQGNFELVCVLSDGQMQHWWRDNDHGMAWNPGPSFGAGVSSPPCMIQGQYGMGTEAALGNFELCVAVNGLVQHWWRNQANGVWSQSATFGHDVAAVAGLIESSYGFNLEVVVLRTDGQLQHYWRDGAGWHEGVILGTTAGTPGTPALASR
jgi:hypothetical protein